LLLGKDEVVRLCEAHGITIAARSD